MRPARETFKTAARRLLAVALGLWLSGAGCLVCCERTEAAVRADSARADARDLLAAIRAAERTSAPAEMSADHSCCKARVGSRARRAAEGDAPRPARDTASDDAGRTGEDAGPRGPEARRQTVPGRACCRRVLQTAEPARKPRVEPAHTHAHSPVARVLAAAPARVQNFVDARTRAPDRGGTYLVCRALLI